MRVPTWRTTALLHTLSYGKCGLCTRKGPRKEERLTYEVCFELIEGTDENRIHFIVDGDASALASAGKGSLDDDLIAFTNFAAADDFECARIVLQKKLEGRLTLLVRDGLNAIHLSHDHHFFAVIVLRTGDDVGHLQ